MSCFNKCLALMLSSAPPHIETISLNSKLTVSHMIHCFPSTAFPNSMSIGNCSSDCAYSKHEIVQEKIYCMVFFCKH